MQTLRTSIESLAEYGDLPAIIAIQRDDVSRRSFAQVAGELDRLASGLVRRNRARRRKSTQRPTKAAAASAARSSLGLAG